MSQWILNDVPAATEWMKQRYPDRKILAVGHSVGAHGMIATQREQQVHAMVMVAAVFTVRPMRGRRTGILVLGAFTAGVGLFFLRNLTQVLGEAGDVPPAMAAFAPPLVGSLLALAALLQSEEG